MKLSDEQRRSFESQGFVHLPAVVPPALVEIMREESDLAVQWQREQLARGAGAESLTHPDQHFFVPRRNLERPAIRDYVRSPHMLDICRGLLGDEVWMFSEIFVTKLAGCTFPFGWHQDTGYVHAFGFTQFPPNITVWTSLDDAGPDNGCLYALPFDDTQTPAVRPHHQDEFGNQVADFGVDETAGVPLPTKAGDVLVLNGLLPHRSGPNSSGAARRAHLVQYSREPLLLDSGEPVHQALSILRHGAVVPVAE